MCSEDQYSTKHQLSSYGSTNILNEYLFFINSQWFSHLKHFLISWFRENIKDMSTIVDDEDPVGDLQDGGGWRLSGMGFSIGSEQSFHLFGKGP